MKFLSLILVATVLSLSAINLARAQSSTKPRDISCSDIAEHINVTLKAESATLSNVIKYLNDNSINWNTIHGNLQSAMSDRRTRRDFEYNGSAGVESQKSRQNALVMSRHQQNLNEWREEVVQKLKECLTQN
jgi:hypothetical protein